MKTVPLPTPDEVHVWFGTLAVEPQELARLQRFLSPDERKRAERLLTPLLRERFVAGRGFLRETLGSYLELPPEEVVFAYGEHGKPYLPVESGQGLSFNLSHGGDAVLLAVARGRQMGIDIEKVRHDLPFQAMASRYFSPRERDELFGLPPDRQMHAFYRCWTRKEACLKGWGTGFSRPSDSLDIPFLTADPTAIVMKHPHSGESGVWWIADLPVPPGHLAALAVTGDAPIIRSFRAT